MTFFVFAPDGIGTSRGCRHSHRMEPMYRELANPALQPTPQSRRG